MESQKIAIICIVASAIASFMKMMVANVIIKSKKIRKVKFRWVNGFGFEDGTKIPYSYYIEVDGIKLILNACDVEKFMKENHLTTNDFRGTNERKYTKELYNYCKSIK